MMTTNNSIIEPIIGNRIKTKYCFYAVAVIFSILGTLSCSTTKNLPEGELLYTGIDRIVITDKDSVEVDDDLLNRIDNNFAFAPNNALLGSSTTRFPLPIGLWVYNANINKKGAFNKWLFNWLGSKPVLISKVKPETRSNIASSILRENGYFSGQTSFSVIPEKKDSLKARIRYEVTFNKPYFIDSIEYLRLNHRSDTLLILNESERLIKKGDLFRTNNLELERQRIAGIMRNNGYYYFRPEYIVYQADSTISPHKISLRLRLGQGVPRSILRPWKIGDLSVYMNGYDNETPTDSLMYKGMKIFYEGKLRVRPSVLYKQIQFSKGELYSLDKHNNTQLAFSKLDIFRFSEFQFTPNDTLLTSDTLNVRITTSYDYPLNGTFTVKGSVNDNDYAGPGLSLNLTRQNVFGGGEIFTASLYGSYEWYTGRNLKSTTGLINNYESGLKTGLLFPRLFLPKTGKSDYNFKSFTQINFNINSLNRAKYYRTLSFSGSLTYDFLPEAIRHHSFTPLRLTFNKLHRTTLSFDSIIDHNPSLYQSMQDQFIPAIEYQYTLDNSSVRTERSKTWWRFTVSEAGNIISGAYAAFGRSFNEEKKLLGNKYAQFIKATTELRYNHYIDRNQRLAMRIGGGIIYSYGNSLVAPYNERFYVGGANSIRAFTIRSVGPGRFVPDLRNPYYYIDQNGDIKFEGNIEYRGRLVGDLDIAVFLDAGNVWLIRNDETRPGGQFNVKHLFKDIALGTGIGLRYDMSMMIFRFDFGYALHYPYDTGKKGYFNSPNFRDSFGIHLALGYPF